MPTSFPNIKRRQEALAAPIQRLMRAKGSVRERCHQTVSRMVWRRATRSSAASAPYRLDTKFYWCTGLAGLGCINRRLYYFDDFNQTGQCRRHDIAVIFGAANHRADCQCLACRTPHPNDSHWVFHGVRWGISGDTICRAAKILTSAVCWLVKFGSGFF